MESARVAAAWSPKFDSGLLGKIFGSGKTVLRGGYSRMYARMNGINLVQVPLQGPELASRYRASAPAGRASVWVRPASIRRTAFRIGVDGLTAPLPAVSQISFRSRFSRVSTANAAAGVSWVLDPNLRPPSTDQFDFTIQREITSKVRIEVGYVGRLMRNEQQAFSMDSVPYMTTLNGQSFSQAFANTYQALSAGQTPQVAAVLRGGARRRELHPSAPLHPVAPRRLQQTNGIISSRPTFTICGRR